ncbi:MAG: DUF1987 domain-containing protein [Magnetococcales bacterium]|nr:DUF1987 domain-containing protein [Magnetococcales bacterium]
MDDIRIQATERTPELDFNFSDNQFALRGESYPEDVPAFFSAPLSALEAHLGAMTTGEVAFLFQLTYFNSTSAKVVMKIFELLDETAAKGVEVTINWRYLADDDNMEELGQEFGEDLQSAKFVMCPLQG